MKQTRDKLCSKTGTRQQLTYMMIYVHIQAVAFAAIAKKSLQNGLPKSCWDSVLYDITL